MTPQFLNNAIGTTLFLTAAKEFSKSFVAYLKKCGFTDDEVRFLDTQGALFFWALILDDYIIGKQNSISYELYNFTLMLANLTIPSIPDLELQKEMAQFITHQNLNLAIKIRHQIGDSVKDESIKVLAKKFMEMLSDKNQV